MDTIFGYVTYIFDDHTVKVHVTDQKISNTHVYGEEENVRINQWKLLESYKGDYDVRISLIYNLLHRKVRVEVLGTNNEFSLNGKMTILPEAGKLAS